MIETNIIHNCDCLEGLRSLPDNVIDMCITSPPYYNLRDYKHSKQLGIEDTREHFINNLVDIFEEVRRVLKPEGSCWVNIGDTYKNKELQQVPSRLEIAMTDKGWILRNEVIWEKPNPQPISAKDRLWTNHEKLFMFVKSKKYYFDQPRVPQAESSIKRAFSKNNLDKRKDKGDNGKAGFSITSQRQDLHYEKLRQEILAGKIPTRPKFTVWRIPGSRFKGGHFAVYPVELLLDPIKSCSPEGGIVLDPFMGSGTTAVAALELNRKYIGFELNEEYVRLANERIQENSMKDFF